jgi:catechol 2,3-dioxygenase
MDVVIAEPGTQSVAPLDIHSVTLAVRDLVRVADFYRDVVGLTVIDRDSDSVRLGAGGKAFVELQHRPEALPNDPAAAGLYHTAFLLPSRGALGSWLVHARSLGVTLDGAADHGVSEAVYLADPEGNGIEIYADRSRSEWTWIPGAAGPQLLMGNARLDIPALLAVAGEPWTGAPGATKIGHVHLQVGDIGAATGFYAGVLGMDVMATLPKAVFLSTGGYHHHLALNEWNSAGAPVRDPRRAGLASVTLVASSEVIRAGIAQRSGGHMQDPWCTQLQIITAAG